MNLKGKGMNESTHNARWRWYHAGLLFGALQVFLFGLGYLVKFVRGQARPAFGKSLVGSEENNDYYNQFRQPVFAPPDWVFAPIWTLNNSLVSWGIVRVLNMPADTPGRERFLALQAAFLLQFVNFNAAYFGLSSPINGALLTLGGLTAVAEAMRIAVFEMKDWRVALSLSTLLPWLVLASFTSVTVALWNRDGFFGTRIPIKPPLAWVKRPVDEKQAAEG
jgi:tryptophan-rich sensory protein